MCVFALCVYAKEIFCGFEMHKLLKADTINLEWTFGLKSVVSGLSKENFNNK